MLGFMDGFLFAIGVITAKFVWGLSVRILDWLINRLDKGTEVED